MAELESKLDRACAILRDAIAEHRPIAVFAAFSGGHDSLVSTHFTMASVPDAMVLHIDTGIGIPETQAFVRRVCAERGWPLRIERTPESYEELVLKWGFPGRKGHALMYQRLKQRAIEATMRAVKAGQPRDARVMIVSGIRADESKIRAGYQREVSKVWSQVWVNPLYWLTAQDFREYMARHSLPRNRIKDLIHLSGECLCGAFADPGELFMVSLACPATAARIKALEARVRAAGFPWGWEDQPPTWFFQQKAGQTMLFDLAGDGPTDPDFRPLCNACEKSSLAADGDQS
jgi:3'-phosphoadenosine 5'-phosphosulfate sulfotransferase (PAPS reductase)/FAD synthetase